MKFKQIFYALWQMGWSNSIGKVMGLKQLHRIPQRVVRFYGNPEYARESIVSKQIAFVNVSKFNDPFDPLPLLDDATFFKDESSLLSLKEGVSEESWDKIVSEFFSNWFVFCTHAVTNKKHPKDSLYMWGHYGDGHRGIAIEFSTSVLANRVSSEPNQSPWLKMKYTNIVPKIKYGDISELLVNAPPNLDPDKLELYGPKLANLIHQRVCCKSKVWKSENEWRLVVEDDETGHEEVVKQGIPNDAIDAITAVYLGCMTSKQLQNEFLYETKKHFPKAKVFLAHKKPGEYALDFEEMNEELD